MNADSPNRSSSATAEDGRIDKWRSLSVLMIGHARENADHAVNILKVLMETADAQAVQSIYERETALLADRIVSQLDELTRILPIEGNLLLRQMPGAIPHEVSPPIVSLSRGSAKTTDEGSRKASVRESAHAAGPKVSAQRKRTK